MIHRIFFSLALLTTWSTIATANTEAPAAEAGFKPVKVQTITVKPQQICSRVEVVGTVQAVDQAAIAAKITGTIVDIPVVLGSRVARGDLLIKINAQEISARVLQAQAQLAQAKRNLQREEKLLKQQASTPETVHSMRDMLAVAKAGYREAASMLDYTTITAPFAGVITRKIANSGDLAIPGTPLLYLENPEQVQVVTSVPAMISLQVKQGEHLTVHIPATTSTHEGTVAEISPVINPQSRTSNIKINLAADSGARSGMFARVQLPGQETTTLMIPEGAVVPFGQLEKIFVVHEGKAQLRLIRTGVHSNHQVEILSGLQAGEQVITTNNHLLVNGQSLLLDN